ncbi:DJ-1/PfpI/YhbO family deglycase/protease [candidate division KSB1 bacterium]|nr:DJ-1/PfpI/YhbO family deglycase/protease [candidate division KSB1 bacterium]
MLKGKRVAILIGPKFHDEEATIPRDFLQQQGVKVDLIGLDTSELTGKYDRITLKPDLSIDQAQVGDYDGLIIPGGGAPERIRLDDRALDFVRVFWGTGRPVGTICHGAQVLISARLLEGVTLTCVAGIRDDVMLAGARYVDQAVCIDGQLISSRQPEDLPEFNDAFARALDSGFATENERELDPAGALLLAANRERGAKEFYLCVSQMMERSALRNKFKYLSNVEQDHYDQLVDLYKKITAAQEAPYDPAASEIRAEIAANISAEEAIELAMNAEQKAYDFYRHAAAKSKSDAAREMFEYLAAEELEHKRLLSVDRAADLGGERHFQWATHWDVPPGMDDLW